MRVMARVLFIGLILCIPIVSVLGAQNIVCRAPDFYTYQFTKSQVTDKYDIGMTDEELGKYFSDFMIGKKPKFENIDGYDQEQDSFSTNEGLVMEKTRDFLNISIFILVGALFIVVASYWILVRDNKKEAIRIAFKFSWIFYIILWILFGMIIFIPAINRIILPYDLLIRIESDYLLAKLITQKFLLDGFFVSIFISAIIMGIIGSLIWRFTRQKRMFS
jgi:hypothetical protein